MHTTRRIISAGRIGPVGTTSPVEKYAHPMHARRTSTVETPSASGCRPYRHTSRPDYAQLGLSIVGEVSPEKITSSMIDTDPSMRISPMRTVRKGSKGIGDRTN